MLCLRVAISLSPADRLAQRAGIRFTCGSVLVVPSPDRQQIRMAWRKYIILHEPQCVIREAATDDMPPVVFHKFTEIIGINDRRLYPCGGKSARLEPAQVDPFLYFLRAGMQRSRQ